MEEIKGIHFSILIITCLLMITMGVQAYYSTAISSKLNRTFIYCFALITFCAVMDWFRLTLNGSTAAVYLHYFVVSAEYASAPLVVLLIIRVLGRMRENYFLVPLFVLNIILQFSTGFTNWIFYIDDANMFVRGDYFRVYVAIYTIGIFAMYRAVYKCSQEYQNRNYKMLLLSIISLTVGVGMNEVGATENRTTFLAVAIASALFYIYFMEISIQMDALTKLLNRRCFDKHIKQLNYDKAIVFFDVNKFKSINDNYGHKQGDLVLQQVASNIRYVFGNIGYIYRIGGDEFAMILKPGQLEKMNYALMVELLEQRMDNVRQKENPILPSVSMGHGIYREGMNKEKVISRADQQMYSHKNGSDRS